MVDAFKWNTTRLFSVQHVEQNIKEFSATPTRHNNVNNSSAAKFYLSRTVCPALNSRVVQVMENLESLRNLEFHYPGLEDHMSWKS